MATRIVANTSDVNLTILTIYSNTKKKNSEMKQ